MKKTYAVKVDVTMGGFFYVEADSPEEAERIVNEKRITPSDLRNFFHLDTDIDEAIACEDE